MYMGIILRVKVNAEIVSMGSKIDARSKEAKGSQDLRERPSFNREPSAAKNHERTRLYTAALHNPPRPNPMPHD